MQRMKRRMAALSVDGKLYDYVVGADYFTCGLMPVARVSQENWRFVLRWGFIDKKVRGVIPCCYGWIADIAYNQSFGLDYSRRFQVS